MGMNKDTSLLFMKMERDGAKDAPEYIQEMLEVIEQGIKDDALTYEEFVTTLADYFKELAPQEATSTPEERERAVKEISRKIINKYKHEDESDM